MGATHERIADPWLARNDHNGPGVNTMGTIYMSEQSLDLMLQTVEMYRTGIYICKDKNVNNKSYPDGLVYYSDDSRGKEMANLQVLPSKGYIKCVVTSWNSSEKIWILSNASENELTVEQIIDSLKPGMTYRILFNGRETGTYQANQKGEIKLKNAGNFTGKTEVRIISPN